MVIVTASMMHRNINPSMHHSDFSALKFVQSPDLVWTLKPFALFSFSVFHPLIGNSHHTNCVSSRSIRNVPSVGTFTYWYNIAPYGLYK